MEDTKFKVGDKVRIIARNPSNRTGTQPGWNEPNGNVGTIGYVADIDALSSEYHYSVSLQEGGIGYLGWFSDKELEGATKKSKPQPTPAPKFILQYDKAETHEMHGAHPFELFATEKELREHITQLAADSTLKRDSIKVYDIKRVRSVKLGVKITITK